MNDGNLTEERSSGMTIKAVACIGIAGIALIMLAFAAGSIGSRMDHVETKTYDLDRRVDALAVETARMNGQLDVILQQGLSGPGGPATDTTSAARLTLDDFRPDARTCYDRSKQPQTAVVDSHLHFRPFGGAAIPFDEVVGYLEATGVLFANVYGIGQMLPAASPCTYYLDCPDMPLRPTLRNDFVNAANVVANTPDSVHLTASLTFPGPRRPGVGDGRHEVDGRRVPGRLRMDGRGQPGQAGRLRQRPRAGTGRRYQALGPFMEELREREMPLAIHADLGSDEEPTRYLPLMRQVLATYPDNAIVWMHMGLSRELKTMDPAAHAALMAELLADYPNLTLDISWRVLNDAYFSTPKGRAVYVPFLNEHSERILPGTDFLASCDKDLDVYREELEVTSRILGLLKDDAFEDIALGRNYFRLLGLVDYEAPAACREG